MSEKTENELAVEELLDELGAMPVGQGWSIHQRLAAILGELPAIGKDAYNQQQKFHYRSHDDVLNALNPLLARYGVTVVPHRVAERIAGERTTGKGSTMYEVNLRVVFRLYGLEGDWVEAQAWGEGTDMGDKSTNKAMTMAFKNVLAQTFAVSTADTVDTDSTSDEPTTRAPERAVRRSPASGPSDPGKDLIRDAIQGEGFQGRLRDAMNDIDPTIDWASLIGAATSVRFGVRARADIPEARLGEYWTRLSNAISKLVQEQDLSAFPPLGTRADGEAAIIASFTWAFGPFTEPLVIPRLPDPGHGPEPKQGEEEIPWVEDVQQALDQVTDAGSSES